MGKDLILFIDRELNNDPRSLVFFYLFDKIEIAGDNNMAEFLQIGFSRF